MLNDISWQGYWTFLAVIVTGYYLAVFLHYYRADFKIVLKRKFSLLDNAHSRFYRGSIESKASNKHHQGLLDASDDFQMPPKESNEYVVYACMDELTAFFEEAKSTKCEKDELIHSLQLILKKYPTIKTSDFKDSLSKVIITECEHILSISLSEGDVDRVWLGLSV